MNKLFITGIGTGVGKTIVSAILTEKLRADYWKPIQSGDLENSDTMKVRSLVSNSRSTFHPETYRLTQPLSPHRSAEIDGIEIRVENIRPPETTNTLIIEGAGGLMVPLSESVLMLDLISQLQVEVVLVSANYLGSINHTLLSAEVLKTRNIPIKALIFCGDMNPSSQQYICSFLGINSIYIPHIQVLNKENISKTSDTFEFDFE